ncbi:dihydroxy-acid dehydratase domain-containing protein [Microbispora sp. CA-102843]|uniref:dihydroxy-acid dehydratase domain-containing protein n=1 Tax=Microbispora sp. CA-102843 TaxID=3239952 RepID=UPI003D91F683
MTSVAEVLGLTLPGAASIPAVLSAHTRMAAASGRLAVDLAWHGPRPSQVLDERAYRDAVTAVLALGGSTNAVIHLIAMARRSGVRLTLDDFDAASRRVPVLADVRPGGAHLMEDFHRAGGVPALLHRIAALLHLDRPTVGGPGPVTRDPYDDTVIRHRDDPVSPEGGLAVLRGNLAPGGAVIKHVAAEPRLLRPSRTSTDRDWYTGTHDR